MKPQRLGGARLPPPRRLCQCARSAALEALRRIGVVLRDTAGGWFLDVASGDTLLLFLVWLMEAVCVVGGGALRAFEGQDNESSIPVWRAGRDARRHPCWYVC
jgi:hypothetical protein